MTQPLSARAEAGEDAAVLLDELWQLCRGNTYVGDSKQRIMLSNFLALMQVNTPRSPSGRCGDAGAGRVAACCTLRTRPLVCSA